MIRFSTGFSLKRELDTTELIKWLSATIGAVVVFALFKLTELKIELAKTNRDALQAILDHKPRARIHYTNLLSPDATTLEIRVFLMATSTSEIQVAPPALRLLDRAGHPIPASAYVAADIGQFQGSISPDTPFHITYRVDVSRLDRAELAQVELEYRIRTSDLDAYPLRYYAEAIEQLPVLDGSPITADEYLATVTTKTFTYSERIYTSRADNPVWDGFWDQPR